NSPLDNPNKIFSPGAGRTDKDLSSHVRGSFIKLNVMTTLSAHPRCLQPCRTTPNNDNFPRGPSRLPDHVAKAHLPACSWIVQAGWPVRRLAMSCPHTGTDLVLAPHHQLLHDVGICNLSPCHPSHVELAF